MTIPFQQIPSTLRTPLFFAEVNNSNANTATQNQRTLLIGNMMSTGTATANIPTISQGTSDAKTKYGLGSILAQMLYTYRQNDSFGEVWCLPLADDPSAVAATGTIAFTAAPTATGVLYLYIGGIRVLTTVTAAMTTAQVATAVAASINANPDLAVTAAATTTTVTITGKNKGAAANDIDIRVNYLGEASGEVTPAGLAYTITAMANGAVNPTLTSALANLVDLSFDFIAMPYTDATSLNAMQSFLNDVSGRWSWSVQIYGHMFCAYRGTSAALGTFGVTRNDQHASIIGFYDSPTPNWKWAAAYAAQAAISVRADPGQPLQTLVLQDVLAPPLQSRFLLSARNTLLYDGISTFTVDASSQVHLEGTITTYQLNSFGVADNSYLQINTMFLLMYVLRQLQSLVTTKYARSKLAASGTVFAPGSNIVTPVIIRADLIAQYNTMQFNGFVQQAAAFAAGLIVQINANNPNRVDVLYDAILIDQLNVFALLALFRNS
ncbi:phage tail sheath subtilisin-like domain-containing protein [Paraburkholderia fungorum]|uniref:phage tail sheath subtilisin-like domain-containing protein n=1 Tax=Paraburkholderia fungorum TaxID=134537 RepID=UPI00160B36BC|nr:phage tail sheath subtilisin-like domain-containing protein [Paraburkholderia fungorum]MBB5547534.1 phage tail sheath gpL-like [Paraburkholderia fungorum]